MCYSANRIVYNEGNILVCQFVYFKTSILIYFHTCPLSSFHSSTLTYSMHTSICVKVTSIQVSKEVCMLMCKYTKIQIPCNACANMQVTKCVSMQVCENPCIHVLACSHANMVVFKYCNMSIYKYAVSVLL